MFRFPSIPRYKMSATCLFSGPGTMRSDFDAARVNLELAYQSLSGDDEFSVQAREAIELLVKAVTDVQAIRQLPVNVAVFPADRLPSKS